MATKGSRGVFDSPAPNNNSQSSSSQSNRGQISSQNFDFIGGFSQLDSSIAEAEKKITKLQTMVAEVIKGTLKSVCDQVGEKQKQTLNNFSAEVSTYISNNADALAKGDKKVVEEFNNLVNRIDNVSLKQQVSDVFSYDKVVKNFKGVYDGLVFSGINAFNKMAEAKKALDKEKEKSDEIQRKLDLKKDAIYRNTLVGQARAQFLMESMERRKTYREQDQEKLKKKNAELVSLKEKRIAFQKNNSEELANYKEFLAKKEELDSDMNQTDEEKQKKQEELQKTYAKSIELHEEEERINSNINDTMKQRDGLIQNIKKSEEQEVADSIEIDQIQKKDSKLRKFEDSKIGQQFSGISTVRQNVSKQRDAKKNIELVKQQQQENDLKFKAQQNAIENDKTLNQDEKDVALAKAQEEYNETAKVLNKSLKDLNETVNNTSKDLGKALSDSLDKIDTTLEKYYEYAAKYEARLEGSRTSYKEATNQVSKSLGLSPFFKQSAVIDKMQALISSGISYNVEFRSFLDTIKDDIIETFSATDETLLRLIRMQQADSTAARLGMEAYLNKMYNKMFEDTEYLNSQYDRVAASILEASAQLSKEEATAFDFEVQKWLGALYSVGLSDSTIDKLAQAINSLGTGNVESLNNDQASLTLVAMGANRAGLSYSELLTKGLNSSNVNKLLTGITEYLGDISKNVAENKVVANAYSNLLGFSMSDYNAINNIQSSIKDLTNTSMSYNKAMLNYTAQTALIPTRMMTNASTMVNTLIDNAWTSAATGIAGNGLYPVYEISKTLKDMGIDLEIPFVNVWGFGVDLNTSLMQLIQAGTAGIGLLTTLLKAAVGGGGILGEKTFLPSAWGYDAYTRRGGAPIVSSSGVQSGFSESSYMDNSQTNSSMSDITNSTLSENSESANEMSEITNANNNSKYTFDDVITANDETADASMQVIFDVELLEKKLKEHPLPVYIVGMAGVNDLSALMNQISTSTATITSQNETMASAQNSTYNQLKETTEELSKSQMMQSQNASNVISSVISETASALNNSTNTNSNLNNSENLTANGTESMSLKTLVADTITDSSSNTFNFSGASVISAQQLGSSVSIQNIESLILSAGGKSGVLDVHITDAEVPVSVTNINVDKSLELFNNKLKDTIAQAISNGFTTAFGEGQQSLVDRLDSLIEKDNDTDRRIEEINQSIARISYFTNDY